MNRYKDILLKQSKSGIRYRKNTIFPVIKPSYSDIYVISTSGDRYDTLALEYYRDPQLWWVIASINSSKKDSLVVEPGRQLRIPSDIQAIKDEYRELNKNR
mgnify:FL=1